MFGIVPFFRIRYEDTKYYFKELHVLKDVVTKIEYKVM